jgi:uncharacterized membrane-anchored protein
MVQFYENPDFLFHFPASVDQGADVLTVRDLGLIMIPVWALICLVIFFAGLSCAIFRVAPPTGILVGITAGVFAHIVVSEFEHELYSSSWWYEVVWKIVVPAVTIVIVWIIFTIFA